MKLSDLINIKDGVASLGGIIVGDSPYYANTLIEKLGMPITKGDGYVQAELNLDDQLNTFARLKIEVNEKLVKRVLLEGRFSQLTKQVEDEFDDYIKKISSNEYWYLEYDTGWIDNDDGDYQYKGREYVEENSMFSLACRVEVGYDENTRVGVELNILGGLYGDCGEAMQDEVYKYVQNLRNQEELEKEEQDNKYSCNIDNYIDIANSFLNELDTIKKENESKDYSYLLDILNCVRLDSITGKLRIRFANDNGFGDKSWFYCCEGQDDDYMYEYNKRMDDVNSFFEYYMNDDIYDVFNHLKIELSEMGAWQVYLLSRATHFLPVYWHGGYSRRSLVLSEDDIKEVPAFDFKMLRKIEVSTKQDVSPSITIEGNTATVKCCYWNNWIGLARETVKIDFFNGKAYFLESPTVEVLFNYNCGIKY